MNFFDGGFRSKPNIKLSGASKLKTKEDLLKDAANERLKRETEKKQYTASLKIQSAFRSYLVRKRIKDDFRKEFDSILANKNEQVLKQNLNFLISTFVKFFNINHDKDRLIKLNPIIVKYKELIVENLNTTENSVISLAKFLLILLKWINNPDSTNSQSISLRIIDYFTDPSNHIVDDKLHLMFNYLIKNGYVKEMVNFALVKIPKSANYVQNIPMASSIAQLFYRCFLYLKPVKDSIIDDYNKNIINSISNELFTQSNSPQIKCIMESLAGIVNSDEKNFNCLFEFLIMYSNLLGLNRTESYENQILNQMNQSTTENIKNSLNKIYCILILLFKKLDKFSTEKFINLLSILKCLLIEIPIIDADASNTNSDENDDEQPMDVDSFEDTLILNELIGIFKSDQLTHKIEFIINDPSTKLSDAARKDFCMSVSYICNFILLNSHGKIHENKLLARLAFNKTFLKYLWQLICSLTLGAHLKQDVYLLKLLANGSIPEVYENELIRLVAPLSSFCALYNLFLLPILDEEFLKGEAIFSKQDLINMSAYLKDACIGIITLMHPEVYSGRDMPVAAGSSSFLFASTALESSSSSSSSKQHAQATPKSLSQTVSLKTKIKAKYFTHLFQVCSQLVQRMFIRDIRFGFCPENHWLSNVRFVSIERIVSLLENNDNSLLSRVRFGQASYLFVDDIETECRLSLNEIRQLTILQELPFIIPFDERVKILESLTSIETGLGNPFLHKIRIRRNYLYEDAFDNLSSENVPNIKAARFQIEMINEHGLDEAGIDGGGVFREFILKLFETGFDPNRGFFVFTSDGYLYPNPNVSALMENYKPHYEFLGKMLAKAIQLKILTPLKFANFFLQKILSKKRDTRLDIDYLASLDPEVYRNLILLKDSKCNVKDLELNFAVDLNEFGQTRLVELKPGGKDIPVTNDNKIEYIHLLSDYKLNTQINQQVIAFRNGIASVINPDILKLFNFHEFQNLMSGDKETIDVDDWKHNTVYSGEYNSEHVVIKKFWKIVENMSEEQKRKLLKFATSRSRPPLFGFKNLIPNFAIQSSDAERLPTASTCLNLLKLPRIENSNLLKEKLICAIESDAGFELS